jgi:hypothetical protein
MEVEVGNASPLAQANPTQAHGVSGEWKHALVGARDGIQNPIHSRDKGDDP